MTADQRAALARIRIRSWLMGDEARHLLQHSAAQTGDTQAVTLAAAVVTALERLRDYVAEQSVKAEEGK